MRRIPLGYGVLVWRKKESQLTIQLLRHGNFYERNALLLEHFFFSFRSDPPNITLLGLAVVYLQGFSGEIVAYVFEIFLDVVT
jgi:hypothetical protein